MSINQLIARGVAPIGQDLPQIGNMLMQRQQAQKQNALAEMAAKTDATRANAFASQVSGQQQSAQDNARREALQRSFDTAAQFPEVLPQFVSDLRQSVAPDLPENATLAQIAMRLQLQAPKQEQPYSVTQQEGPFGSRIVTDGKRFDVVSPPAPKGPESGKEPNKQLVTRPTPDGRQQDFAFNPQTSRLEPVGEPYAKTAPLSPKDTTVAKQKLTQLAITRNQLKNARAKFEKLKGTFSAGPGGKFVPTPAGKAFDAAIDGMRGSITALTRVPGVGAMSDYETRLDQAKFPERGDYEDVIAQKLDQLDALVAGLDTGYSDLLGGVSDTAAPAAAAPAGGDIVTVSSPAEAMKLPPGTKFKTPDGRVKVR